MMAKAIWIDDQSGAGGVVFCSVDCVGLFKYDVDLVKESLKDFVKETGCRSKISAPLTTTPASTPWVFGVPCPEAAETKSSCRLLNGIKKAIELAYADRREGSLYLGYGRADEECRGRQAPPEFSPIS